MRPTCERVSYCLETSPPSRLPPQDGSLSLTLLSLFLSFIFCSTSFRREWAAFLGAWCPLPVFRSCFVELLGIQIIFQWFSGEESGLPILFLHLRTTSPPESPKIKSLNVSPSICCEVMGPDAMILVFWMVSFNSAFYSPLSLSSRSSLVLHFLLLEWYHLHIWGCLPCCKQSLFFLNFFFCIRV